MAASVSRGIDLFDAPSLFDDLDQQMAQMQRSFQQMEQQMNDDVGRIMQRSSELKEREQMSSGFHSLLAACMPNPIEALLIRRTMTAAGGTTQGWIQGKDGAQTYRSVFGTLKCHNRWGAHAGHLHLAHCGFNAGTSRASRSGCRAASGAHTASSPSPTLAACRRMRSCRRSRHLGWAL